MIRPNTILRGIRSGAVLLLAAAALLLIGIHAQGQALEKGIVTGLVNDSSGAIVGGARITIYNTATDLTTVTTTNGQGLFVSPPLDAGDYDVQVKAEGFKSVHQSLRLEVGQRVSANIILPVGNSSETVEVHAAVGATPKPNTSPTGAPSTRFSSRNEGSGMGSL